MPPTSDDEPSEKTDYVMSSSNNDGPVSKDTSNLVEHLIAAERLTRLEGDKPLADLVYQSLLRLGQIIAQRSKLRTKGDNLR